MDLRVAVASDLHVGGEPESDGGWLHAGATRPGNASDLVGGLRHLIRSLDLNAHILLCPGDMTDKANPTGLIRAWEVIQHLRTELKSSVSIATAGNHDLDSRGMHTPDDPALTVRDLYPPFPIGSDAHISENDAYWANGFTWTTAGAARIVSLNSSRYHTNAEHAKRGKVRRETVEDIAERLRQAGPSELNVLLTHHHPMKLGVINSGDDSNMYGGEVMLELLLDAGVGPWMVIHGHKHVPRFDYFYGGARVLPVLACGSLSARLWDEAASVAKNQFYLIDFSVDQSHSGLDPVAGRVEAYSWVPSKGWSPSGQSGGVMWGSGFGWRWPLSDCADAVEAALDQSGRRWLQRSELVDREPRYEFLTTQDQLSLHGELHDRDIVVVAEDSLLQELGRRS